jgi:hypothetical protein
MHFLGNFWAIFSKEQAGTGESATAGAPLLFKGEENGSDDTRNRNSDDPGRA